MQWLSTFGDIYPLKAQRPCEESAIELVLADWGKSYSIKVQDCHIRGTANRDGTYELGVADIRSRYNTAMPGETSRGKV